MHPQSRQELCGRLEYLAGTHSLALMLIMRPRGTSNGLIVVRETDGLRLCYPHFSWHEFRLPMRCWRFALRMSLRPRFARWGKGLITSMQLGVDPASAAAIVERCYNFVFDQPSPFWLEFQGSSWQAPAAPS